MRKDELRQMTRLELVEMARQLEIKGSSRLAKEDLVEAIAASRSATRSVPAEKRPRRAKSEPGRPRGPRASAEETSSQPAEPPREVRSSAVSAATPVQPTSGPAPAPPPVTPAAEKRGSHRRPEPDEAEDEEGQRWNSTALGRDPNYGRFLSPGSVPPRHPLGRNQRNPGQAPPFPHTESLADRSERGRQRAVERSQGIRDELRRTGELRRGSPYVPRYGGRLREQNPRGEGNRYDRTRLGSGRGDRPRPDVAGRDRNGWVGPERERRGLPERGRPDRNRIPPGRDRYRQDRPVGEEGQPPLEPPRVHTDLEGFTPMVDAETGPDGGWDEVGVRDTGPEGASGLSLPEGADHCRLTARDPSCVYASWEVSEETTDRIRNELGDEWEGHRRILRVHGTPIASHSGGPPANFFDIELEDGTRNWVVQVGFPDRAYHVDVGVLTRSSLFYPMASSNTVVTRGNGSEGGPNEQWAASPEETAAGAVRGDDSGAGGASSAGVTVEPGQAPGGDPALYPAPAGKAARQAPPAVEEGKRFHFTLTTEIIVHGATEPDAKVILQGVPITLEPDGTFVLRYPLPDGVQVLDAIAFSADGRSERSVTSTITQIRTSDQIDR